MAVLGRVWGCEHEECSGRGGSNYRPTASKGLDFYFYTAYALNTHGKYFLFDDSYERAGTLGFRCAADAVMGTSEKPMFWNGNGNYCVNDSIANGLLMCGSIWTGLGRNDLSVFGAMDWVQFGGNGKDKSEFKMNRKETNEVYIANITSDAKSGVAAFDKSDLPRGYYWNDGSANGLRNVSKEDALTSGVFISEGEFEWSVNHLKGGNVYKLRVFVGVWYDSGVFEVELNIDGVTENVFSDSTVYETSQATNNVCYELIIDLSSIASDKVVQLFIHWIASKKGHGNITLQAIALQRLLQMN